MELSDGMADVFVPRVAEQIDSAWLARSTMPSAAMQLSGTGARSNSASSSSSARSVELPGGTSSSE